jgi:hypothetical protein
MAALFSYIDAVAALSPANITIFQAARLAENPLDLRYRAIFPRVNATSIRISSITTVDFRPVGGRREWNAQGREIPENLGPLREAEIVPIEFTKHIDERAMQLLREAGIEEMVRRGVINSVETWPTVLADACERQLERDAFEAWFTGLVTVKDTKTNDSVVASLGFDQATTYPTAGTDWDDPGEDAYLNFLTGLQAAQTKFGGAVGGARTHRTVAQAIIEDAPDGPNGLRPTISSLQERVREEGFPNFNLIIDERTYDEFNDGGSATTAAYYVPDGLIGYQPADGRVGNTHVAPVARAYDFLTGGNRKFANGVAIFLDEQNSGKTLKIAAQENALAIPEERLTYVEDTGIAR